MYYGYITSEVRSDVGAPSFAMLKSEDGLTWVVLPPPIIHWGRTSPHHREVNFCERDLIMEAEEQKGTAIVANTHGMTRHWSNDLC
jgi:hypothetical protein